MILKKIRPYTNYIYLHLMGEPLLNNNLKTFLEIAKENDFKVNLKSEIVIEDLHVKMDEMIKKQKELYKEMEVIKNNYARIQAEGNTIEDNKAEEQTDLESQTEAPQI